MDNQPASTATPATKTTYFIIFLALVAAVGMYGLVAFLVAQSRSAPPSGNNLATLRPIMYILAGVVLLASIAWMHFRTHGRIGDAPASAGASAALMSPGEFQTQTIVGLALAEACAIFGLTLFFLGAPLTEFARFAAATVLVDLLYFLPKALRYWSAWETQQKSSAQSFS